MLRVAMKHRAAVQSAMRAASQSSADLNAQCRDAAMTSHVNIAPMNAKAPISSECPNCHQERAVTYSREELAELLQTGSDIEVMCVSCDETWQVSTDERADIARALERGR
jgi:redox-regulated HSP33 family molecular chaperone